ncbi:MATE family efflux transporter [Halosegnis rubeus]|jgi:putative MATE family efflux protein|uniref:Multidrug-efflux transporter n=1 Tax=Halosegnis rubeus TaxID=2212850 RepID=A0A5N5UQB7_9EURY|nr:MATE family efflux transporter [Halosegnis rubeus]KAB7516859.1 MATE family efflux transporter [Halosegnis rubeus]KAB7520014.1 MATE family efflux transporter [Halosegnis rubeus]
MVLSALTSLRAVASGVAARLPNPVRGVVLVVGLALARLGLADEHRVRQTTDLAWPRVVTGIARMSKNAVDVAMVGTVLGSTGVAGVGFAGPYWGLAFALGGGAAAGAIALVSQRFGSDADNDGLAQAVRSSAAVALLVTLPVMAVLATQAEPLIRLVSDNAAAVGYGGEYLRVVAFGVPFAALNLVGSRVFIGVDDARTPMLVRGGAAVANIGLNALFIFGFGLGAAGAGLGTVLSNAAGTLAFTIILLRGHLPGVGSFPVSIDVRGPYLIRETVRDVIDIGTPVFGRSLVWTVAEFPMFIILDSYFGVEVAAAFVIARRIWGIMNTPGWGFELASSSLVGRSLGANDEAEAEAYGREIVRHAVGVYLVSAVIVAVFAEQIVGFFADSPTDPAVPIAVSLVYAACVAVIMQGVSGGAAGPLDASGDTRWPFAAQFLGMFCCSIPLAYVGGVTSLGMWGLYLAFVAETTIPALLNYYRFRSGVWKRVSEQYRPDAAPADD